MNPEKKIPTQLKIALVDDHDLVREGLNAVLVSNGATDIDKFGSGTELIESLDSGNTYDFFVIDLELPDIDGFVLIEMLRARNPVSQIIVSTVHDEVWTLRKLLSRDVNAIIYKSGDGNEIVEAIHEILNGRNYYCKEAQKTLRAASDNSLHPSSRELQVLYQIAQGKTSREIAAAMFITENTVEAHRKALFTKLGAVNVADLIIKSIDRGYLKKNMSNHPK